MDGHKEAQKFTKLSAVGQFYPISATFEPFCGYEKFNVLPLIGAFSGLDRDMHLEAL